MANAATLLASLPMGHERTQAPFVTKMVHAAIDTINTDLTLLTPGASNYVAIVGLQVMEPAAFNITYTSGSTVITVLEYPVNSKIEHKVGEGVFLTTLSAGAALKIQTSVVVPNLIFYLQEFKDMRY